MDILVCVKRVPATGGKITLTPDQQEIDTRYASFTVSPHEECAVEEAIRQVAKHGGTTTVLTLGPPVAADQLRDAMAMGMQRAILLQTDGREWDPQETARAILETVEAQRAAGRTFDLLLFGNEAADTGDYQVGIRVAHALGWPVVAGVKALEIEGGKATVRREASGGWEIFELDLPAVLTVK
ncbi:MAG: electron transfer flavoprotein beta subunit/FixA family protein, partial [Chloroflexi bacterium]|nr:electron transfer flavoprotein beta subunit/FixA family protein [Chloroflexota bacterium]